MTRGRRALLILLVLVACVGCDQLTKSLARHTLAASEPVFFLKDLFRLQYVENRGAFLSLGASIPEHMRYWLLVVVGIALAGVLIYLLSSKKVTAIKTMALSLAVAGGIGNLIDRILNEGRVVDFMNLGIGSLRTGIFNVADIAILVGTLWLLVDAVRRPSKKWDGAKADLAP